MQLDTWLIYFAAALGLSLSPGPNGLLALTHGVLHGGRKTAWTIAGGAVGFVTLIALSMFGIGALLQTSLVWLTVLKWLGGAYLVWLGIQVWRATALRVELMALSSERGGWSLFRQGALSAMTNPKGILFFAAFLPQFIDPARDLLAQFLVMAFVFVAVEIVVEFGLALLAHRIRPWLQRAGRRFNRVCGGMFVTMGLALPMTR